MFLKRCFDLFFATLGLLFLAPVFLVIGLWIKLDSKGPVFFRQQRVGQFGKLFRIHKFRTMVVDAEKKGAQVTVGEDSRITRAGRFLRKYKLDELPQLIDIFLGQMSLVGPRPEVPKYVACYPDEIRDKVLSVKPGITDLASIEYRDENALLAQSEKPEETYKKDVLPIKLGYYSDYVENRTLLYDYKMILRTIQAVFQLSRWQKRLIMITADLILIPLAFWSSYAMRLGTLSPALGDGIWLMGVAVAVSIPVFIRLGLYRAVIRFSGSHALGVMVMGVSISTSVLVLLTYFAHLKGIPRSVFIIYWGTALLYIGGSRYLVRQYYNFISKTYERRHVAIYGAGQSGAELAQALFNSSEYLPVLFLDDNSSVHHSFVAGLKVYHPDELDSLLERYHLEQILLAIPSSSNQQRKEVIRSLEKYPVHIKTIPDINDLVSGKSKIEDVREIAIDDLLGRDSVSPDPVLMAKCIEGKNILVTGAGGSIGSELCRQIILIKPARLVLFERSEFALYRLEQELVQRLSKFGGGCRIVPVLGSVGDAKRLRQVLTRHSIETLYHAAAYKHVPLVEHNPFEGVINNVIGTYTAAQAAQDSGVRHFVLISTDKAVRPTNVMGASKRLAELAVQALASVSEKTIFCMVRFGNVLDSSGSVVPLFRQQIKEGGPVTVTHPDIIRYFMTIPEAAQLVIQAGAIARGGEVFLLDMGEPVKIYELAQQMIRLAGHTLKEDGHPDGDIEIKVTGLRPGEKLYEELLIDSDARSTGHPKIFQAEEHSITLTAYQQLIHEIELACDKYDNKSLFKLLEMYVSGYTPAAVEPTNVVALSKKPGRRN